MGTEVRRQLVHIAVGGFALLLRWLTWREAALLAVVAILFNRFVMPRIVPGVFRAGDLHHPATSGIVMYPIAVLLLVVALPHRLDIVAAAWGILAAGDGMATLVGAHVRTSPLPWNPEKSIGGLVAFVVSGGAAAVGLMWWTTAEPAGLWVIAAPLAAALVAGAIETAPIRLNDNLSVPAIAAIVLWSTTVMDLSVTESGTALLFARAWQGAILNLVVAWIGWRAGTVTPGGALTGAVIGTTVFLGTGVAGWTVLMATFLAAAAATRAGFARKSRAGIAEDRGGRRGPGNALANTGVAAWAALVAAGSADPSMAQLALVGALATAGSDTVASEVGKAWGRSTRSVAGFRRVAAGTPGAVSVEGTLAGMASAAVLAAVGALLGLISPGAILVVTVAATIAAWVESALGATVEARGILNNDALNFVNASLGAALSMALVRLWSFDGLG